VLVLAIDTSSAAVTAAVAEVADGVTVLARQVVIDARAHGERLAPGIALALARTGAGVSDLRAVVAGVGPGPFTGLRVGLVTAAAMGDALGIPTYGVCSLDAIAGALDEPSLLVAGDARRREVYWARYRSGVRVAGPAVAKPADLVDGRADLSATDPHKIDSIRAGSGAIGADAAMAGAGARLYADVLGLRLADADYPSPEALVRLAAERIRAGAPSEPLTPLYLRRPDVTPPGTAKSTTQPVAP